MEQRTAALMHKKMKKVRKKAEKEGNLILLTLPYVWLYVGHSAMEKWKIAGWRVTKFTHFSQNN